MYMYFPLLFQMKFSTADMQAHFKDIIDEIKTFEGINHRNLVKYYGVEVHRVSVILIELR